MIMTHVDLIEKLLKYGSICPTSVLLSLLAADCFKGILQMAETRRRFTSTPKT
jgi:hypothetical protein